ncbi:MAG: phosphonate metabolism protein PhnM [Brevinematales bacterium]|nr:phosphonate metabolism protein PhnM [Brevinematales bacterium]
MEIINSFQIKNANIVLENEILKNSSIYIENGIIKEIEQNSYKDINTIDAGGSYVLPGFIDLHCDAIEKEIEVRPNVHIPFDIAITELDKKMAMAGITTIFHSISFAENFSNKAVLRTMSMADKIIQKIKEMSEKLGVENKIHLRYEITYSEAIPIIEDLIKKSYIDLLSIMDHTPGQGQFKTLEQFKNYYQSHFKDNEHQLEVVIKNKQESRENYGLSNAKKIADICKSFGVPLASHDDDTIEKIDFVRECGAIISEFPMSLEVASYAHNNGISVIVGSPNIVRGGSHNNNIKAIDVIKAGYADIVCSDYIPSTLIYAFAKIYKENILSLPEISKMFSLNPAKAIKLDKETGKIEKNYKANLIIVDLDSELPRIQKTFVNGVEVYSSCTRK